MDSGLLKALIGSVTEVGLRPSPMWMFWLCLLSVGERPSRIQLLFPRDRLPAFKRVTRHSCTNENHQGDGWSL